MNRSICSGLLALFLAQSAAAATCTWLGSGADNNWSNSNNWDVCGNTHFVPADGDTLHFLVGTAQLTNHNDLSKLLAAQLLIDGGINVTGNSIGLSGGIVANVPITSTAPEFHPGIELETNAQTFACSGAQPLKLYGNLNLHGQQLTVDGACDTTLSGNIIGDGGIVKNGAGSVFLEGAASTYTGTTTINGGVVIVRSDTGLGADGSGNETIVNTLGALQIGSNHAISETLTLSGLGPDSNGALVSESGDNTVTGAITLAANSGIGNLAAGTTLTIAGPVGGGNVTLTKRGAGTVRMQNVNSYGNTTFVLEGTLEADGVIAGNVSIQGGTLAGTGTAGSIIIQSNGIVSPGTAAGANTGTLDGADLFWGGGGKMAFQLGADSAHSDQVFVSGEFGRNSSGFEFQFSDGATPPVPGMAYTLVSFATTNFVVGDFSFSYAGTGPGSSMSGAFSLTTTELQFTPSAVVSDLIFRNGVD